MINALVDRSICRVDNQLFDQSHGFTASENHPMVNHTPTTQTLYFQVLQIRTVSSSSQYVHDKKGFPRIPSGA